MDYNSFNQLPIMLNVTQLADVLDIGLNSAYDLVRSGQIHAIKIGRQYRISKESLRAWIEDSSSH